MQQKNVVGAGIAPAGGKSKPSMSGNYEAVGANEAGKFVYLEI